VNDHLEVEPSQHFASKEQALAIIEPCLRAWEINRDLIGNWGEIRFTFDHAEMEDRNPPPPGPGRIMGCEAGSYALAFSDVHSEVVKTKYSAPPENFDWSTELDITYQRWKDYLEGKEPLLSMANFIISYMTNIPGGEKAARDRYCIYRNVLKKIRRLCAYKGTPATARKAPPNNVFVDLTDEEREWLIKAIPAVIHRIGEHAAGADVKMLSMSDLPTLTRRRS